MENAINMVWELFVEGGHSKKEKEGKKKGRGKERKERGKEEREREGEERERERRRKGKWCFDSQNFRLRSKVRIFDEGYAPRGRDSSYLGLFLSFELLFWSAFGTTLCHVYGMFCGFNWNMAHFAVSIEMGL